MNVRCASCGYEQLVDGADHHATRRGAMHLRDCPKRDDLTLAPWWTTFTETVLAPIAHTVDPSSGGPHPTHVEIKTLEVGWHPLTINEPYTVLLGESRRGVAARRVTPTQRFRFTAMCGHDVIGYRGDTTTETVNVTIVGEVAQPIRKHEPRCEVTPGACICRRGVTVTGERPRWELKLTGDDELQAELLADGWEPFSAFLNVGWIVAFRRRSS